MVDPPRIELGFHLCKRWVLPLNYEPMSKILKNCLNCNKEFYTEQRYIDRGHGKYCSQRCSSTYYQNSLPKKKPNCICAVCKTAIYKNASEKENSKSGLFFCNRKCKEKGQSLNFGLKEIQPKHYGTAKKDDVYHYRRIAFNAYDKTKCSLCGYSSHPEILVVHHKDKNRMNDSVDNLQVLCPNCHEIVHRMWSELVRIPYLNSPIV